MKTIYLLKGLPASGKSTWSKQKIDESPNTYKRVNKDDLRAMLDNGYWSSGNERFVLRVRDMIIKAALHAGKHVICDDTNLHPKHEARMREIVREYKEETGFSAQVIVKFFDVEIEECIRRDLKRNRSVGERVIRRMYKQFMGDSTKVKLLEQDNTLPKAIICDLDGTLALLNRNPFDASTCEEDELNQPIADIVKTYKNLGHGILLVSGRQEKYEAQTKSWLAKHEIPYDLLILRQTGDIRKDSVMKEEVFNTAILGKWFVDFVLEDRNQVVEMWRKLGLVCCQVAKGDF